MCYFIFYIIVNFFIQVIMDLSASTIGCRLLLTSAYDDHIFSLDSQFDTHCTSSQYENH